jgi:hypothetical protein
MSVRMCPPTLQVKASAEHEEGTEQHERHVVRPHRRLAEHVARRDLVGQAQDHRDQQPTDDLARPDRRLVEQAREVRQ